MSDPIDFHKQARQHLSSLLAAGIEYLPRGEEPTSSPAPQVQASDAGDAKPAPAPVVREDLAVRRRRELEMAAARVAKCERCPELVATRTQTVFGVGNPVPELCFVGEAPGADEDRQGQPFVGAAGQLLDRIIAAMGMKREEVFICNILRCRPPGNRTPKVEEAGNCSEHLEATLQIIEPKFICALGLTAAQNLLRTTLSLTRLRGRFHDYRGIPVICTYHPASLLPSRSPENKRLVWEDMKMLLDKMGRPVPAARKSE